MDATTQCPRCDAQAKINRLYRRTWCTTKRPPERQRKYKRAYA